MMSIRWASQTVWEEEQEEEEEEEEEEEQEEEQELSGPYNSAARLFLLKYIC